jgi:preprotein translocase subunit Sec63
VLIAGSHPDKIKLAENQTQEDADSKFVQLTKAYKALTDEGIRENLAKYGNPDGPQQREDKIAIPSWVVEGKNNIWVLGAYGLVLGGGIPWVVVSLSLQLRSSERSVELTRYTGPMVVLAACAYP